MLIVEPRINSVKFTTPALTGKISIHPDKITASCECQKLFDKYDSTQSKSNPSYIEIKHPTIKQVNRILLKMASADLLL